MDRIAEIADNLIGIESPDDLMLEILEALPQTETIPEAGNYYTFVYQPKTPGIRYDEFPLVAVTDATMISKEIDMIVMVVKVGHTDKKAFEHTINNLRNVNAPLGGIILNAVTHKNSYGSYYYNYYYQYYNYYGSDSNNENS